MKILAISGSLKSDSSNSNVLRAMSVLATPDIEVKLFSGLDNLPHFSPDRESDQHQSVNKLREELKSADGVIICTPEYAFGVPGVLKNGLDWVVSSGEFNEKPVAVLSASPLPSGGDKAHASLLLTLNALGANVSENSKLIIPAIKKKMDVNGNILDQEFEKSLRDVLQALIQNIEAKKAMLIQ